jgi:hypothetical protein
VRNPSAKLVTISEIIRSLGEGDISMHYGLISASSEKSSTTSLLRAIREGQALFLEHLESNIISLFEGSNLRVLLIGPSLGPLAEQFKNGTISVVGTPSETRISFHSKKRQVIKWYRPAIWSKKNRYRILIAF